MRWVAFLFLAACGGAEPSSLLGDASTSDDVVVNPPDVHADATPPACASSPGACADPNVPQGWTPVIVTTNTSAPCPSSFGAAEDVVGDPSAGASACTCSCTKTQDPDCQTGNSIWSGVGQTCATGAATLSYSGGKCRLTNGTVDDYDEATKIAPSGGTCSVTAAPNGAISSTPTRICAAQGECQGAVCGGFAPAGFTACIVSDGDVACPASSPFSTKHVVDTQPTVQCSDCGSGCTFVGDCVKPQLTFYSDQACSQAIVSIPADGTCTATGHANAVVAGLKYTATPSFTGCTATGSSTASVAFDNPRTLCCR